MLVHVCMLVILHSLVIRLVLVVMVVVVVVVVHMHVLVHSRVFVLLEMLLSALVLVLVLAQVLMGVAVLVCFLAAVASVLTSLSLTKGCSCCLLYYPQYCSVEHFLQLDRTEGGEEVHVHVQGGQEVLGVGFGGGKEEPGAKSQSDKTESDHGDWRVILKMLDFYLDMAADIVEDASSLFQ